MYDITNIRSFENITKWIKELKENADHNTVLILIGNKSDLNDKR